MAHLGQIRRLIERQTRVRRFRRSWTEPLACMERCVISPLISLAALCLSPNTPIWWEQCGSACFHSNSSDPFDHYGSNATVLWLALLREEKWRRELAWEHSIRANNYFRRQASFWLFCQEAYRRGGCLLSLLPVGAPWGALDFVFTNKEQKRLAHDVLDYFATSFSLVYDITDTDCSARNSSTHDRKFLPFKHRTLTKGTRNRVEDWSV